MSRDIIINQSKQAFIQAMMRLLKTEDFDEISIKQLVLESGYSRRTYYRYFSSKTAILDELLFQHLNQYRQKISQTTLTPTAIPNELINFVWPNHTEMALLAKRNLLVPLVTRHIAKIVDLVLTIQVPWRDPATPNKQADRFAVTYSVGGFCMLLNSILVNQQSVTAEQLIEALTTTLTEINRQISEENHGSRL